MLHWNEILTWRLPGIKEEKEMNRYITKESVRSKKTASLYNFSIWRWSNVETGLHYSEDFIFMSFGIMDSIVELWNH